MSKAKVSLHRQPDRSVEVEPGATVGAVIGRDLRWPNGDIVTMEALGYEFGPPTSAEGGPPIQRIPQPQSESAQTLTTWGTVVGVPDNLRKAAALTGRGYVFRDGFGAWSARQAITEPVDFAFDVATPFDIITFTEAAHLSVVNVIITEPFNGAGATLSLREASAAPGSLVPDFMIPPGEVGATSVAVEASMSAGQRVVLDIVPGAGATEGRGKVRIEHVPLLGEIQPGDPGSPIPPTDPAEADIIITGDFPDAAEGELYHWLDGDGVEVSGSQRNTASAYLVAQGLPAGLTLLSNGTAGAGASVFGRPAAQGAYSVSLEGWVYGRPRGQAHVASLTVDPPGSPVGVPTAWDSSSLTWQVMRDSWVILSEASGPSAMAWMREFQQVGVFTTLRALSPKAAGRWYIEAQMALGFTGRTWFGLVPGSMEFPGRSTHVGAIPGTLGVVNRDQGGAVSSVWWDGVKIGEIDPAFEEGQSNPNATITIAIDADTGEVWIYRAGVLKFTTTITPGAYVPAMSGNANSGVQLPLGAVRFPVATFQRWTI